MSNEVPTYGNFREPRTPGLPGLGLIGTIIVFAALVIAMPTLMIAGWLAGLVVVVVAVIAIAPLLFKNRSGRNGWQVLTARLLWAIGSRKGQATYDRDAVLTDPAQGQSTLPGLLARSRMYEGIDAAGNRFGLLHVPATRHYSVILTGTPEGDALVDQETADTWVARYGHWLADLGDEPQLEAASVTVETAPDPGGLLSREVDRLTTPDAPQLALAMLAEVTSTYAKGAPKVSGRVALTFSATRASVEDRELLAGSRKDAAAARSRVMSAEEMAIQVGSRLPGLIRSLAATGIGGVRPLTGAEIAEVAQVAYDPALGPEVDARSALGLDAQASWATAGPAKAEERWAMLTHGSGASVTWQMTQPPRSAVQSGVLRSLLEPTAGVARKRVTLLYRPHDPASTARIADADVRTAKGRATARKGENRAGDVLDLEAARQAAREEARGAGMTRFSLLTTATVLAGSDPVAASVDLMHVADRIDRASKTSRLRLRKVYASQSAAFAAALGIGVVPTRHVAVPAVLREYL